MALCTTSTTSIQCHVSLDVTCAQLQLGTDVRHDGAASGAVACTRATVLHRGPGGGTVVHVHVFNRALN